METKNIWRVTIFFIVSLFIMILPSLVNNSFAQQKYEWKLQSAYATAATLDGLRAFAENVKKASNGRIEIKVYEANQLVKIMAIPSAVQSGAIEMGNSGGVYLSGLIPESDVEFGLPFSWRNWNEAWEVWTKYGLLEKIREAYSEKGLYFITIQPVSDYVLMTTKPVNKVDDLRGLRIRSGGMFAKIVTKFGAVPVMIPGAEQYVALQRGTADGTIYPCLVLDAYKLKEVLKYVIFPSFVSPPMISIFMNLKLWNSLPKDLQNAINEAAPKHHLDIHKRYEEEDKVALDNFTKVGGKIIHLPESEVKKLRKAAVEEWEELGTKSPRCKALVEDMKKFLKEKGIVY